MLDSVHGLVGQQNGSVVIIGGHPHMLNRDGGCTALPLGHPTDWNNTHHAFPVQPPVVESKDILSSGQGLNIDLPVSPSFHTHVHGQLIKDGVQSPKNSSQSNVSLGTPGSAAYNMMLHVSDQSPDTSVQKSPTDQSRRQVHTERIGSLLEDMLGTITDLRVKFQSGHYDASSDRLRHLGNLVNVTSVLHDALWDGNSNISPAQGNPQSAHTTPELTRKRRGECVPELTPLKAPRSNSVSLGSPLAIQHSESLENARSRVFSHMPSQLAVATPAGELSDNAMHQFPVEHSLGDSLQLPHTRPMSPAKLFGPHVLENTQLHTPPLGDTDTSGNISPEQQFSAPGNDSNLDALDDEAWESFGMVDKVTGGTDLPLELRVRLESIFHEFLNELCSNLDATDDRGEPIHQTLMPKKMARLDESPDFRPFKFRIQAFTNAFQSAVIKAGLSEDECSIKRIKQFLWTQPYISRFNEDGKKAKSKGNHIWNIEAKKLPAGKWEFRAFAPKITGETSTVAYANEEWKWHLRVWDPQAASSSIKVVYSVNSMPDWIHWDDAAKVLTGVPTASSQGGEVSVTGLYVHMGQLHRLEHSFFLDVQPTRAVQSNQMQVNSSQDHHMDGLPATTPPINLENADAYFLPDAKALLQPPQAPQHIPTPHRAISSPHYDGLIPPLDMPHVTASQSDGELRKHEVLDPTRASHILSSITFPFTPPVYTDNYRPHMGLDQAVLSAVPQQQPQTRAPQQPQQHQNSQTYDHTLSAPCAPVTHDIFDMTHNTGAPTTPGSVSTGQQMTPNTPLAHSAKFLDTIEQRQKAQMSSFMLTIPERRPGFVLSDHSGNTTPMSSMPGEIAACLPQTDS